MQFAGAAGGGHACLRSLGVNATAPARVFCWGRNDDHQINDVTGMPCLSNEELTPATAWAPYVDDEIGLAIAGAHSCAIADEDSSGGVARRLYCWGANLWNELGTLPGSPTPTKVNDLDVLEVATSIRHTCVITQDQQAVQCWGDNRFGEVGNGARFRETPVQVQIP